MNFEQMKMMMIEKENAVIKNDSSYDDDEDDGNKKTIKEEMAMCRLQMADVIQMHVPVQVKRVKRHCGARSGSTMKLPLLKRMRYKYF